MNDFKSIAKDNLYKIDILLEKYKIASYPGKKVLQQGKSLIKEVLECREAVEFFEKVYKLEDDFLDYGEDSEEVFKFFKEDNIQKKNFDVALEKIKHANKNIDYLDEEAKNIVESMKVITSMDKPYNKIHELPMIIESYNEKLLDLYEREAELIRPVVEMYKDEVINHLEIFDFIDEIKSKYINRFDELMERLDNAKQFNDILAISQLADRTRSMSIQEINKEVEKKKAKETKIVDIPNSIEESESEIQKVKQTRLVSKTIMIPHQPVVTSIDDIEIILRDMRIRLEKEFNEKGEFKLI